MEKYYSLRKAGEMLGIRVRTCRQWIHDGKIVAIKYPSSNRWYISESEIVRLRNAKDKD